ncbi:MAG: hypothetical protein V1772_00995 [Chloroflexota bacterium]
MGIGGARQTWRILLLSASEATRDEVGAALAIGGGDHRLVWVSEPDLALSRAQDAAPDIILVDDELGEAKAIATLIERLVSRAPRAAVLTLLGAGALAKASQVVLSGARGFVIKPVQPDDLMTTLGYVMTHGGPAERGAEERTFEGRIIVFVSPKGGTGRSTLAINTAIGLRMITEQPVALVDADYAAPALDVALNLQSGRSISDLLSRASGLDEDLMAGVLVEHASGVRVLLAPPPTEQASTMSVSQVQHILVILRRMFAWVVVDLGLPAEDFHIAFVDEADRIVMSVLPEMVGLRNARLMLDQLRALGHSDDSVWLVINRATIRGGVSARDIEQRLHLKIKQCIPDDPPLATYSINLGVPLAMGYPRSAVALAVRELAKRLVTDLLSEAAKTAREEPVSPRSFFSRVAAVKGRPKERGMVTQEGT